MTGKYWPGHDGHTLGVIPKLKRSIIIGLAVMDTLDAGF